MRYVLNVQRADILSSPFEKIFFNKFKADRTSLGEKVMSEDTVD